MQSSLNILQGSHLSGLTKFHISMIFPGFLVNFQVFFLLFLKCDFQVVFNINLQTYQVSFEPKITHFQVYSSWEFFWKIILNCILWPPNLGVRGERLVAT